MSPAIFAGDCRIVMQALLDSLGEGQYHAIVTDPPYHLESIVSRFGKEGSAGALEGSDGRFKRASKGFMGRGWDGADKDGVRIAHDPMMWRQCLRLLRPGGFCLAFSSPRTGHWQAVAMEQAGFILHPFVGWLYGQGMSKGHSISPEAPGWEGWYAGAGTLKPALEPIYIGQKPFSEKTFAANVRTNGVGAYNVEDCRVPYVAEAGKQNPVGRWPANLVHDSSPEVEAIFPDSAGQLARARTDGAVKSAQVYGVHKHATQNPEPRRDTGSASRFFMSPAVYASKSPPKEREAFYTLDAEGVKTRHPTQKPQWLIEYLIRHVCPPGGLVLDPFGGSGTTAAAAENVGMRADLIEADPDYYEALQRRFSDDAQDK